MIDALMPDRGAAFLIGFFSGCLWMLAGLLGNRVLLIWADAARRKG